MSGLRGSGVLGVVGVVGVVQAVLQPVQLRNVEQALCLAQHIAQHSVLGLAALQVTQHVVQLHYTLPTPHTIL